VDAALCARNGGAGGEPVDLDSRPAAQRDRLRPAPELRTGWLQAGHCSARQLRQCGLAFAQLVVEHAELSVSLDTPRRSR
jgi:hypothetical protein